MEDIGGSIGLEAVPVGMVVVTKYRPGAIWRPHPISPGEAALSLISNALAARSRPRFYLNTLRWIASEALAIEGERGEVENMVEDLLKKIETEL